MKVAALVLVAPAVLAVLLGICTTGAQADSPALDDSTAARAPARQREGDFDRFLRGLADTTDVFFGRTSVEFDTTGLDSMVAARGGATALPGDSLSPAYHGGGVRQSLRPIGRWNRSEGAALGATTKLSHPTLGGVELGGSYGYSNQEWRYSLGWSRTLRNRPPPPLDESELQFGETRESSRLVLSARYADETLPFAPEHAHEVTSALRALATGLDGQSVYERRAFVAQLAWIASASFRAALGYRDGEDETMQRTQRFSLWGARTRVPPLTAADPDTYGEVFGSLGWKAAGGVVSTRFEGQFTGPDRWRLRTALGRAQDLGSWIRAYTQLEAGAAASHAPRQLRFELGGSSAVPTLEYGYGGADHLLLGTFEVSLARDLLRDVRLPHPAWVVLQPGVFVHGGAVWDEATNHVTGTPEARDWRGAAGISLLYRPGLPGPAEYWRFRIGWPLGRESGHARLAVEIGRAFDLVP